MAAAMKILRHCLFGILVSLCRIAMATDTLPQQDRFGPLEVGKSQARCVMEVFSLPSAAAYDLIGQNLKGPEFHARVMEALKAGTASLDTLLAQSSSGDQSRTGQTESYLYPTELDPPQLAANLVILNSTPKSRGPATPVSPKNAVKSPFNGGIGILTTATPTAFQTQELGDTLVIDCSRLDEHGRLPVSYKLGSTTITALSPDPDIHGPVFSFRKLEGAAQLMPSEPAFLGTYSLARRTGVPQEHVQEVTSLAFMTPLLDPKAPPAVKVPAAASVGYNNAATPLFKHVNLRSTLEVFSMDKSVAHALFLEQSVDTTLYHSVTALVAESKARRETTICARCQNGIETTVENADEHVYPTEFDPPQVPMNMILGDRELLKDLRAGRQMGVGAQPPVEGGNPNGGFGLITTLSPSAFQKRNLGERLKLDVSCIEDRVDATVAVE
ncbi:MAG: hypothetical protein JWO94_430, partial [Verrucomicrobiaceae bacterium]|nr:hypothetical protein [Verrucomicrobiaceae bacterium]